MTVFERLLSSGLPITWTAVRLAWEGIPFRYNSTPSITEEEVRTYAMDRIGYELSEQEALVAELAFSCERDTWTIQRCLEALASEVPSDVQYGWRIWRWVMLDKIITELERQASIAPDESAPYYWLWSDDFRTSVCCDLDDFWSEFEFPAQDFGVTGGSHYDDWSKGIPSEMKVVEAHRDWLVKERAVLRGEN